MYAVAVATAVSVAIGVRVGVVVAISVMLARMQAVHGDCPALDIALRVFAGPVKGDAYGLGWRGIP